MFPQEVKKESELSDDEELRLGARQCNMVRLSLKSGEKAITLTVQRQNEEELCYRIGMNTKMRFLMKDYCERKGLGFGTIKFIGPEGGGLGESQTPQDLDLEDGDAIDAFDDQSGGQCFRFRSLNARDLTPKLFHLHYTYEAV